MFAKGLRLSIFACFFTALTCIGSQAQAGNVQLAWDPPTTHADGTPVQNLAGYRIHWGQASGSYHATKEVGKDETSVTLTDLSEGETYYFAATAFDLTGNESEYSNEVSTTIPLADTDGDGLTDREENEFYGTDPNLADTDGDGLSDGTEVVLWEGAWADDYDDDGLINLFDPDADNDGFMDGTEYNNGFNPGDSAVHPQVNDTVVLPVQAVTASTWKEPHVAANTGDGDLSTAWSAEGDGQWISYDLGTLRLVSQVAIAWKKGDQRSYAFTLEVSTDGTTWTTVYSGDSSGTTLELESYGFEAVPAQYVRLVGYGNTDSQWNSVTEVEIWGR